MGFLQLFLCSTIFVFGLYGQTLEELRKEISKENRKNQILQEEIEKYEKELERDQEANDRLEQTKISDLENKLNTVTDLVYEKRSLKEELDSELTDIRRGNIASDEVEARYQRGNFYSDLGVGSNLGNFTGSNFSILNDSLKFFLNANLSVGYKFWYLIFYGDFFVKGTILNRTLETTYTNVLTDRESILEVEYSLWVFNYSLGVGIKTLLGKSGAYLITDFHPISFFDSSWSALDKFCPNSGLREACDRLAKQVEENSKRRTGTSFLFGIGFTSWDEEKNTNLKIEAFCYVSDFENIDFFYGLRVGLIHF